MSAFWNKEGQKALSYALIALYVLVSPLVFLGSYHFIGDLLDFSHFGFLLPPYLGYVVIPLYLLALIYLLAFPGEKSDLKKLHLIHGSVLTSLGLLLIVLVSSYIATGFYWSPVMGTVNYIFPIDLIIYGCLAVIMGVFLLVQPLLPGSDFSSWKRKERGKLFWFQFAGLILYCLIALYLLGALLSGVDFGGWLSGSFALMFPSFLMMILTSGFLLLIVYRENLLAGKTGKKAPRTMILVSGTLFGVGLVFLITTNLYEPNLYVLAGKAYFPIDFEGSLNVAPVVLSLFPFLGFLGVLVPNLRELRKKEPESHEE